MGLSKTIGIAVLVFLIIAGLLVSLLALNSGGALSSIQIYESPIQLAILFVLVIIVILFVVYLIQQRSTEEEDEEEAAPEAVLMEPDFEEREEQPSKERPSEQELSWHLKEDTNLLSHEEFKKFLKNAILELEHEKARIYDEVALLDEDYHKGILTKTEFLKGLQLLLGEKNLEDIIGEKDEQVRKCKDQLAEVLKKELLG